MGATHGAGDSDGDFLLALLPALRGRHDLRRCLATLVAEAIVEAAGAGEGRGVRAGLEAVRGCELRPDDDALPRAAIQTILRAIAERDATEREREVLYALQTCAELAAREDDRAVYPDETFPQKDKLLNLLEHYEILGTPFAETRARLASSLLGERA